MREQVHAIYSGRVQGIGFRWTAQRLAQEMHISGWVRNLSDGRVELQAEAVRTTLLEFLQQIESQFSGNIKDTQITWSAAVGSQLDNIPDSGFDIKR
jgi:acylphosphatase